VGILLGSKRFKFGEQSTTLDISFCCLIDQFLIAPSGALRSLYGLWVFSKKI
jgi:hypothetical protein